MKFDRIDTDEVVIYGESPLTSIVFEHNIRGAWISTCHRVMLAIKHWTTVQENGGRPQCVVEVHVDKRQDGRMECVERIKCEMDGSAAFVAAEVMDVLASYRYSDYDLRGRIVRLRAALDADDNKVTLPRFHKYREAQ